MGSFISHSHFKFEQEWDELVWTWQSMELLGRLLRLPVLLVGTPTAAQQPRATSWESFIQSINHHSQKQWNHSEAIKLEECWGGWGAWYLKSGCTKTSEGPHYTCHNLDFRQFSFKLHVILHSLEPLEEISTVMSMVDFHIHLWICWLSLTVTLFPIFPFLGHMVSLPPWSVLLCPQTPKQSPVLVGHSSQWALGTFGLMCPGCRAHLVPSFSVHGKLKTKQNGRVCPCCLRAALRGTQQAPVTSFEVKLSLQSQFMEPLLIEIKLKGQIFFQRFIFVHNLTAATFSWAHCPDRSRELHLLSASFM